MNRSPSSPTFVRECPGLSCGIKFMGGSLYSCQPYEMCEISISYCYSLSVMVIAFNNCRDWELQLVLHFFICVWIFSWSGVLCASRYSFWLGLLLSGFPLGREWMTLSSVFQCIIATLIEQREPGAF